MVDLNVEWGWMLAGFVVGICCSWFVYDLVFPVIKREENDQE